MQAITMLLEAMANGFVWFTAILTRAGLLDIFSGVMIITIIFFRLISPILRSSGSDRANKKRGDKDNE